MNEIDRLAIETPENLSLETPIAGFGSRCTAAILDYLIIGSIMLLVTLAFFGGSRRAPSNTSIILWIGVLFLLLTFYHLIFEMLWNGQSPGKRWTGLRVVQANGMPLTVTGAIIRNFLRLFDFLPLFYGIGLIALFLSKKGQRLGDLAAGTLVIREQKALTLNTLQETTTVKYRHLSRYSPLTETIYVDALTEQNRQLIVDFLNRRDSIRDTSSIAIPLARQMAQKMDIPPSNVTRDTRSAELFLEQIARAFELKDSG